MAKGFVGIEVVDAASPALAAFADEVDAALERAGNRIAGRTETLYKSTVASWNHRPQFYKEVEASGNMVSVAVGSDDKIFRFVDRGTKPHVIRPRNAKRLVFATRYAPKSKPLAGGGLVTGGGGASGPLAYARQVNHPGIKPRGFSERVGEQMEKEAPPIIEHELDALAKRKGLT